MDALTGELRVEAPVESFIGADHYRRADAGGRHALRRDLVRRGSHRRQPEVRVLQVPRQSVGAERGDRRGALEELHHSGRAETGTEEHAGRSALGTVGRRGVGVADGGSQARRGVHDDRRQLLGSAGEHVRRVHGLRSQDRQAPLDAADDGRRRVHGRLRSSRGDARELPRGKRAGLRLRIVADPGRSAERPRGVDRRPEVRRRARGGSGSGRRDSVADPVGKGGALGGVQWGSAFDGRHVYVALSDVATGTGAGAARQERSRQSSECPCG